MKCFIAVNLATIKSNLQQPKTNPKNAKNQHQTLQALSVVPQGPVIFILCINDPSDHILNLYSLYVNETKLPT